MKNSLDNLPARIKEIISSVSFCAEASKDRVYLVGGFVRDLLLGIPNLDLDIIVENNALDFSKRLIEFIPGRLIQHKRFATASLVTLDKIKIDIATTRSEKYPQPGHLPVISISTLEDDLKRRDFTINSIAVSINKDNFGEVIDCVCGIPDLKAKKIRILHEDSFLDDPTRILRAIRFKVRFDFEFEINTLSLLRKAVRLKMLYRVQKHRLRDELVLILKERNPLANIKELNLLCGLGFIHPGIILNKKLSLLMRSVEKRVCWFENQTFRKRKTDDWLIYFIGLLDGLNYPALKKFCLEYALEKRDTKRIVSYKEFMLKKASRLNKLMKPVLLFKLLSPLSYETIIAILSKVDSELAQLNIINFLANYHTVKISINGETIKSLGIKEGPLVRKILKKVHDAKINKKINCESEELEYLKKIIEKN